MNKGIDNVAYQQNIDNRVTSCHPIEHHDFDVLFQVPWGQNLVIISKCKTIEEALPENLQSSLPSVEAIEAELGEFNAL